MYIKAVHIKNIRSITSFEISFNEKEEAGWHILLGNNGSGKSTIVKSISLALVGPQFSGELRENWGDWLNVRNDKGIIQLDIIPDTHYDKVSPKGKTHYDPVINAIISIERKENAIPEYQLDSNLNKTKQGISPKRYNWGKGKGWFSAAYGPFRRFSGGNLEKEKIYYSAPKAGAHLSVFGEDVALSEATQFIKEVYIKGLEKQPGWDYLEDLQNFINCSGLLPKGTTMEKVTSDDVIFNDANGNDISVLQLSDGYRSVLSLTFELVRQLIRVYGKELVLKNIKNGDYLFDLPGVVLIDEIDTHLHPTWQTNIGTILTWMWQVSVCSCNHWQTNIGTILTRLFPKIQF